jgi:gliding motility-associated-like protein
MLSDFHMKFVVTLLMFLLLFQGILWAEDYFWVGGTGNWSDLNHWRTADNQIPNEVPDANDNVIFNENSLNKFDKVYIQTGNPTCKNMIWENLPDTVFLYGGSAVSFDVYGSVKLHPNLLNKYSGKITFLSNEPGNTIECAGSNFPGDLYFEGNGEWILQDTLIVLDSSNWRYRVDSLGGFGTSGFRIHHLNGRLDANGYGIIGGNLVTGSNNGCELDLENSLVFLLTSWTLNGENLVFKGDNSVIKVGLNMTNLFGNEVVYHDAEILKPAGVVSNTGIHAVYRKLDFLNGGTLQGFSNGNTPGKFTIDTLLFQGSYKISGSSALARIFGDGHEIFYTGIDTLNTNISVNGGTFHRIDVLGIYTGNLYEGDPAVIKGTGNVFDTVVVRNVACRFSGKHSVTGLLSLGNESLIHASLPGSNTLNHVVFSSTGSLKGNNDIEKLTLSAGYQYFFQADSLGHPGSYHTNTFVQTINQLEVSGNCELGVTLIKSGYHPIQAVINYTGGPLSTDYLQIRDIRNTGTLLTVTNGIDAGNNTGIAFTNPLQPRTLYWVNGQGTWSDTDHWSLNSGGPGGECPPTRLDDVFFNDGSGFDTFEDTVLVLSPNIHCNNMTWVDGFDHIVHLASADTVYTWVHDSLDVWHLDTSLLMTDTCALHIYGSLELDPMLSFGFGGDVYFESEYDDDYEIIDVEWLGPRFNLRNKAIFDGTGGKWTLAEGTKFYNPDDSVIFRQGELLLVNDTVVFFNFISVDTLPRKVSLLENTLFSVHQFGSDAWFVDASPGINGNTLFEFDAGRSTIRSLGNYDSPNTYIGQCNIKTTGSPLTYHNIEFGFEATVNGENSGLISESNCTYNRVDYYFRGCYASGTGTIDSLTWHPSSSHSMLLDEHTINVVLAYGKGDALYGSQVIDTALFYKEAIISGNQTIGYLQTNGPLQMDSLNAVDTALILGNTSFSGKNVFSQLILGAGNRYTFENTEGPEADTTIILDDLMIEGGCGSPIRLQSDVSGSQARILYKKLNPTHPTYTANYVSVKDIRMVPWNGNSYLALNSVDLGNNENWIFEQSENETLFWIDGTGNWSDPQHWSYTSGGPPNPDNCIPREINTVVFDSQSFDLYQDTVYVDLHNAYCNNMWWTLDTGLFAPRFFSTDSTSLFVYGSMMLHDDMFFEFRGLTYFDRFNATGALPDTIYSRNNVFLNDVYFQGPEDVIVLEDPMSLSIAQQCILHHQEGDFLLNGYSLSTGAYHSNTTRPRLLDMNNAEVTVGFNAGRAFWLEGENLELYSDNSAIVNYSMGGSIVILNGDTFSFDRIRVEGNGDSLYNQNNTIFYKHVEMKGDANLVAGIFGADSILIRGNNSGVYDQGTINVVVVDGNNGSVNNQQQIKRCFFNSGGKVNGTNAINYCVFQDDGTFLGENTFDTLVLYPGQGSSGNLGNWYYFQVNSTQTIVDSIYVRGNACSNMNISTLPLYSPQPAFLRKDNGADVSADFLNIYNVGAVSEGNVAFYAGSNSTPLPNPDIPPPGWIFENAQGYIHGFNGATEHYCAGETYVIDAGSFNGDPSTQYFWNGQPGGVLYPVSSPGTYTVEVVYYEGCSVNDFIVIEEDPLPVASIPEGPYCEHDPIGVLVSPQHAHYTYEWWNGESTASIDALQEYTGTVSVVITDTLTGCEAYPEQEIVVKPAPDPESALGPDTVINFGEMLTLDAGEGDYYEWSSDPNYPISEPYQRYITVSGYPEPVEFIVYAELDGCGAEGQKTVTMYPPSRLGIPTAFSPNGDGVNDELKVLGSGFASIDFKIFNRFGQLVFETSDPETGWDGTFNGVDQPVEVYTWYIRVSFADQKVIEDSGNVTLLR